MPVDRRQIRRRNDGEITTGFQSNDINHWSVTSPEAFAEDLYEHPVHSAPAAFVGDRVSSASINNGSYSYSNVFTESPPQSTHTRSSLTSAYGPASADWLNSYPASHESSSAQHAPSVATDTASELDTELNSITSFGISQSEAPFGGYTDITYGLSRTGTDYLDIHPRGTDTQLHADMPAYHAIANFPRQQPSAASYSVLPAPDHAGFVNSPYDVSGTTSSAMSYQSSSTSPPFSGSPSHANPTYGPRSGNARTSPVARFSENHLHSQGSGYPSISSSHLPIRSASTARAPQLATPIENPSRLADAPHARLPSIYASQAPSSPLHGASWLRAGPEARAYCRWYSDGGMCNAPLDDVSPAGLARHLRDFHFEGKWSNTHRGVCCFRENGRACGRDMDYASFGKHIASVHLKSTSSTCPDCGKEFGRGDSLARHRKTCHGGA